MTGRLLLPVLALLSWRPYAVAVICCRGEYADNGSCKQCPVDTYQPLTGAQSMDNCTRCDSAAFPDGRTRAYSWAGNGDVLWCNAGCGLNRYWTYTCRHTCADCTCAAPPPVNCSSEVELEGGCVLDPVAEKCFAQASCSPSPCPFATTSSGVRLLNFTIATAQRTNITFPCNITLNALVVAGGGAGGSADSDTGGGGGGAGAVAVGTITLIADMTHTVAVGAGAGSPGGLSGNTVITSPTETVVSVRRGGPGGGATTIVTNGGSGGGGSRNSPEGGNSVPGGTTSSRAALTILGSPGGDTSFDDCSGAGGGGANATGDSVISFLVGGSGGQGYQWPVTDEWYGGGGGGGSCGNVGAAGGRGGGGNGGFDGSFDQANGAQGQSNTGGGGGGGSPNFDGAAGGGGSGTVILALT